MCNHFHILLEVPPRPKVALTDEQLLKRLGAIYSKAFVATVAKELTGARELVAQAMATDGEAYVQQIHERFTYRMHDLSECMKTLLQRFTRWHNTRTQQRGNLWEETFKSVVVEDGLASKTMAAYIDLNPVRAGMMADPAEYRWSSYGEAMGATGKGGAKAKAGLVRAIMADKGWEADARHWAGKVSREYRMILLEEGEEKKPGVDRPTRGAPCAGGEEGMFEQCRDRFGPKRKSGARKMRGRATGATDLLWTERDLQVGVG